MKTLSYAPQIITAEELNSAVSIDSPFLVSEDGTVELSGNFAPDVWGGETVDGSLIIDEGWETWSDGWSGQQSYNGPVMHDSEYLSERMAEDILSEPGEYCICEVYYMPDYPDEVDNWDEEMYTEGWVVLKAI